MVRIARHCELCTPTQETNEVTFSEKPFYDSDEVTGFQEIRVEGYFLTTCPAGHVTLNILQEPEFEILADLAILSIRAKNNRSAVLYFYSSMEAYQKFHAIFDGFTRSGSAGSRKANPFRQAQYGYPASVSLLFKSETPAPEPDLMKLRNEIIENGKTPGIRDVIRFGSAVIRGILPGYLEMTASPEYYEQTLDWELKNRVSDNHLIFDSVQKINRFGAIQLAAGIFQGKEDSNEFLDLLNQFLNNRF